MQILAVGSPKGGVGKTTTAVTVATMAARLLGLRVLLIDADQNRSALDWCAQAEEALVPLDVAEGLDHTALRRLRQGSGYDLAVVDLPGAREGAFEAILTGADAQPAVDALLVPTLPEVLDVRPVVRVIRREIIPLGLTYRLVFCRVPTEALGRARERQTELRDGTGLAVAETVIRRFVAYDEAAERSRTVLDVGGRHHYARRAEADYRALTIEVLSLLGVPTDGLVRQEEVS